MKLKQTLIFQRLGDDTVIVPVGEAAKDFHGILRVNDSGAAIVRYFADGLDEAAAAVKLTEDYEVELDQAREAVRAMLAKLREARLTED